MLMFRTASPEETFALGQLLGQGLKSGDVVCLTGDLGAGKTLLTQGIANGLEVDGPVTSPTFTILNVYEGRGELYHFDLYRLDYPGELLDIGFEEYVGGTGVAVIEWPDKFPEQMPREAVFLEICRNEQDEERLIRLEARGERYRPLLEEMKNDADTRFGYRNDHI
ncbi:MAG TPA: tRNA (adenosine(37)-N6)-threonylcarbamoyltransferase complex ATPase subunit type 1 TsaE [Patescibacteria group bacterium]|nr:tRNA (adenosine(37)-N6)-threonylcarbamoyltransferase complex ATPase subunit type 1 TsaE [Patescibacteria group bacterium]